jgi:hypothetical protein
MGRYDEWNKIVGKCQYKRPNNGYGDGGSECQETLKNYTTTLAKCYLQQKNLYETR